MELNESERNLVAQQIVSRLAETPDIKTIHQVHEENGFKKFVPALLQKGVENLNLSMFSEEMRATVLNLLADEYLRRGNLHGAAKAYIIAGNRMKLTAVGLDFEKLGLFDNAIEAFKMGGDDKNLIKIGTKCMEDG